MSVVEWDLQARLHASQAASVQKISLYLPNRDKHNVVVPDIEFWIDAAVNLLTQINGGSTRLPVARGTWALPGGEVLQEDTTVVYSYIEEPDRFDADFDDITSFVHKFGRTTSQNSVMVEFAGGDDGVFISRAYYVREDDYIEA